MVPLPVPAPIKLLTSAADIPEFKDGVDPLDRIAGVPVSLTLAVLAVIAVAWALVIVVVSPALAVDAVVPIARLEVPAPIRLRTSAALIPEFSDGVVPLESIAGVPESVTLAVLAVMADAWLDVMPV